MPLGLERHARLLALRSCGAEAPLVARSRDVSAVIENDSPGFNYKNRVAYRLDVGQGIGCDNNEVCHRTGGDPP